MDVKGKLSFKYDEGQSKIEVIILSTEARHQMDTSQHH